MPKGKKKLSKQLLEKYPDLKDYYKQNGRLNKKHKAKIFKIITEEEKEEFIKVFNIKNLKISKEISIDKVNMVEQFVITGGGFNDNSYGKKNEYHNKLKTLLLEPQNIHKQEILKCKDLHEVNIYCKANRLTGQQLGPFTEIYLINKCQMTKNKASDCIGDCKDIYMKDNEIKASGGGKEHNKFNYVQIRPNHKIDNYILTAYYLNNDNIDKLGELFIFKIKKEDITPLILKYGGYAHGTKSKNGEITLEDLNDEHNSKEYDLRPSYGNELWNELMVYRVNESDL